MNKKLSIFLVVVMLSQLFTTACVSASPSFSDVTEEHWAYEYVVRAKKEKMINGYEDGTFRPEAALSRAEWAKMVCELAGIEPKDTYSYYDDTDGHWANGYINTVQSKGGMAGWGDGTYKPDDPISRNDAVVSLVYTLDYGPQSYAYEWRDQRMFTDTFYDDGYVKNLCVEFAASKGIIGGYSDGTFRGENALTRAEGAKILCSALDYKNQVDAATPEPDYSLTDNFTKEDLLSLIENHIHADYIKGMGYELIQDEESKMWHWGGLLDRIDKTNIHVLSASFTDPETHAEIYGILGVSAPASILLPERIGKESDIVIKDGYLYVPYGKLESQTAMRDEEYTGDKVRKDTIVAVTSMEILNSYTSNSPDNIPYNISLEDLIEKEIYFDAKRDYGKYMTYEGYIQTDLKAENDDYFLVSMIPDNWYHEMMGYTDNSRNYALIYRFNKHSFKVEFIQELPTIKQGYSSIIDWSKLNPEIVDEFDVDIYSQY